MASLAFRAVLRAAAPRSAVGRELVKDSFLAVNSAAGGALRNPTTASVSTRLSVARLWTQTGSMFKTSQNSTVPFSASAVACRKSVKGVQGGARIALNQIRTKATQAAEASPALTKIKGYLSDHPILFAIVTTLARTGPCDLFAQWGVEGKSWEETDWRRFWGFMFFGATYVGWLQFYIYKYVINAANLAMFGVTSAAGTAVGMALVDQLIHSPFLYFPAFCLSIQLIKGSDNLLADTWEKYSTEVIDVCKASCLLWMPAQMINFYFMPQYLYIPYINLVGAIWVVWLSLQQGNKEEQLQEAAA